jgi:hypothetical protein
MVLLFVSQLYITAHSVALPTTAQWHITAKRYTTFQPAHKATRRVAAGWNVGERGVGMERSGMT